MQNALIVLHLIVVIALVIVVLLQRSEGGLGLGGGSSSGVTGLMTGRGQANALTRTTAILGTAFFILSLALAVSANSARKGTSILDSVPAPQTAPATNGATPTTTPTNQPGVLDELRRLQGDNGGTSAPVAPPTQPQVPTSR
jgi:preprotein translocase subunit SecG